MRKNIKLFIANKEVDCSEGISLPMTYTVEDFQNPTIVKNSFSKTISIPGTKNNNKIFGEIYKLDRFLHIKKVISLEYILILQKELTLESIIMDI